MKVRLLLNDSEIVEGADPDAIVEQMARLQWPLPGNEATAPNAYMVAVRNRMKESEIKVCCATHFLEDLAAAGAIETL